MSDLKSKAEKGSSSIAINWVMEVLALQDKFDKILDLAASKDKSFQTVFNEAFEKFINDNQKSAEFISLFIDENLKKGLKGVSIKVQVEVEKQGLTFLVEIRGWSGRCFGQNHYTI